MHAQGDNYFQDYGSVSAGGREGGATVMTKKGPWTREEDEKLKKCVEEHGVGNWITIEKYSGLGRTSKSCRLRWTNHLRPNLKKGSLTQEEQMLLVNLHQKYGNKWSYIASKLPGRTDNEVKNFWHGRVRRCHRKFQPLYPENIEDDGLDVDGKNNLNDEHEISTAMDDTDNIHLFPLITFPDFEHTLPDYAPFQEQPSYIYNQNPSLAIAPLPENLQFSQHQGSVSSPHGLSSSNFPNHACYTTQMSPSPMNAYPSIQQFQFTETPDTTLQNPLLSSPRQSISSLVDQLERSQRNCSLLSSPPAITQFSAPEQGSPISAPGSSITSLKTNVSFPVPPTTSLLKSTSTGALLRSSELHLSVQLPATSSERLHTSPMPSALSSSNLISLNLSNKTIASPHSSPSFNLTSSIQPDLHLQPNQSAVLSLELPPAWDSSVSEPPSVQTPTSAFRPIPEMKINQLGTDAEISLWVLDAPTQETKAKADVFYQNSQEEQCVGGCLTNKDLAGKTLGTERVKETVLHQSSRKGGFFFEETRTMNLLGQSLKRKHTTRKLSKTRDLLSRKFSRNKSFKPETLMRKMSRREGLLSEISKTGVLLVERGKKETIVRKLLDGSSKREVLAIQNSNTEDMQLGKISKRRKLFGESLSTEDQLSEMHKRKDSVDQKSEESVSICENITNLRNPNFEENMLYISSRRSILLNLQNQTCDGDSFGLTDTQKDTTAGIRLDGLLRSAVSEVSCDILKGNDLLASQGQEHEHEHEWKTLDPVFAFSKSGDERDNLNYYGPSKGLLNESLREECPDTAKGEYMEEQTKNCHYMGESLLTDVLLVSEDPQEIQHESISGLDQHNTTNKLRSESPYDIWSSAQPCSDDQCYEGEKAMQEVEEALNSINSQTEDFSTLMEFSLTTLHDWYDIVCETSSVSDMTFGLETYPHDPSNKIDQN